MVDKLHMENTSNSCL